MKLLAVVLMLASTAVSAGAEVLVVENGQVLPVDDIVPSSPEEVVQRQVNAYNARNLDAFLATYAADARIYDHPDRLRSDGRDAMRPRYAQLFQNNPGLQVQIVKRITIGAFVVDQEHVTGLADGRTVDVVATYEVRDGLTRRVWFITGQ